jgi:hypothetical protein
MCKRLPDWQRLLKTGLSSESFKAVAEVYAKNEASTSISHTSIGTEDIQISPHLHTYESRFDDRKLSSRSNNKSRTESIRIEGSPKKRSLRITSFPQ